MSHFTQDLKTKWPGNKNYYKFSKNRIKENIYQKKGKKFLKGKESVNSLDIAFPPRYSDDIKYFISFSDSPPTYVKLSKKSILKIFNKSKDVKNFIDNNKLNLNEISSLIEIVKYLEDNY